jgi:hypothetical protein
MAWMTWEFLMRRLQEIFQKPQVVHRFERRGMDCVAAKIAQEIPMFFDDDRIDAAGLSTPGWRHRVIWGISVEMAAI